MSIRDILALIRRPKQSMQVGIDLSFDVRGRLMLPRNLAGDVKIARRAMPEAWTLPDGLTIKGNLTISDTGLSVLPSRLTVLGNLTMRGASIRTLPGDLRVLGYVDLTESAIEEVPPRLAFPKMLQLGRCKGLRSLPDGLCVGGALGLRGTPLLKLPRLFSIDSLDARDSAIELPDSLILKRWLDLRNWRGSRLPRKLVAPRGLYLDGSSVSELPADMAVGYLSLANTSITTIPQGATVIGLNLGGSLVETLPASLELKTLVLAGSRVTKLPAGLRVGLLDLRGTTGVDYSAAEVASVFRDRDRPVVASVPAGLG